MKKWAIFSLVALILLFTTDILVARKQSGDIEDRVGSADFLAALTTRIKPGMTRTRVEEILSGFRDREESREDGKLIAGYGYWFGFMPPLSRSGLKYVGEVIVTYDGGGRVIETSYWYN